MAAVLMLILLVAAFSISGTMMMNVHYRKREISLLRSLGCTQKDILLIYFLHGLVITTLGVLSGLAIGLLICYCIDQFKFISLPKEVYVLKELPVRFLPWNYFAICMGSILFGFLASMYPAFSASKDDPSKGIRSF